MTAEELSRRVTNHNFLQLAIGVALIPTSVLLWLISFGFFRAAFFEALDLFIDGAKTISLVLAWLCMIPLLLEGVRHTRPLFELSEIERSGFYEMLQMGQDRSGVASFRVAYGGMWMIIITQILYSAPRTIVLAIKALRSGLPRDETTVGNAARILNDLKASREWTLADEYEKLGAALPLLVRLELVWTETKLGRFQVRYPAGTK